MVKSGLQPQGWRQKKYNQVQSCPTLSSKFMKQIFEKAW